MADRYVRDVDAIADMDERKLVISVDYDSVVVAGYRLERDACEEFARAFTSAIWEAADNARLMREEAAT